MAITARLMYPPRIERRAKRGFSLTRFAASSYYPWVRRALYFSCIGFSLGLVGGCNGDKPSKSDLAGHNVLLITLDTIRADRIGCYGYAQAKTPALDALASRSVLFDDAISQVPLTLPSHASILTGRLPKEFGVRNNNHAALGTTHPTLATIFKDHGYSTAAFVATFVLDARFGLNRGFDHYDDKMSNVSMKSQPLDWEQPANIIADRTISWLEANKSKPFFVWSHFYDPHDPYTPPDGYPKTYDGEIAFMDTQVKRLTDWLDKSGQRDRTLVIVVGDHAESFGEHGEEGHGMFLYNTSLHVPFMISHPSLTAKPSRVANTVGAVDIFPTVLDLFGWASPEGLHSTSLVPAIRTGTLSPRNVFSESDYVWHSYGWAQQRSFTSPDWKFISSTRPELYDRKKDPGEKNNLLDSNREVSVRMSNELFSLYEALKPVDAAQLAPSAAALAGLAALGYTGGTAKADEFLTAGTFDPKDKLSVVTNYKAARKLMKQEKYDEAAALLDTAAKEAPDSLAIHAAHGSALLQAGKYQAALDVFDQHAMKLDPFHQPVLIGIGDAYYQMNNFSKAELAFGTASANDPLDPTAHYKRGKSLLKLNQPAEAQKEFEAAVRVFPDFPEARFELAVLLTDTKQYPAAIEHYSEAVRLKPDDPQSRYNLGRLYLITGLNAEAVPQLQEAVRLKPDDGQAWINLGIAFFGSGRAAEGKDAFNRATQIPASAVEAHMNLAIACLKENDGSGATGHYEKILQIAPNHPEARQAIEKLRSAPP